MGDSVLEGFADKSKSVHPTAFHWPGSVTRPGSEISNIVYGGGKETGFDEDEHLEVSYS